MPDQRRNFRGRVYYGGRITIDDRRLTVNCLVTNFSSRGAKVEFAIPITLPDQVDLTIPRKGISYVATLKWQNDRECGVAFRAPKPSDDVTQLDIAMRQRALQRANRSLRDKLEQLRGFA